MQSLWRPKSAETKSDMSAERKPKILPFANRRGDSGRCCQHFYAFWVFWDIQMVKVALSLDDLV